MAKTSKSDVKKIVKSHFNITISDNNIGDRIVATTHEVYPILLKKKKYVVRIATKDKPKFYTEIWALKNQQKLKIPGPKMFKWDDSKKTISYRYMIEEYVEGEHIPKSNKSKIIETYKKLSKNILQKIHKQKTDGYGPLNDKGNGDYSSWKNFLEAKYKKAFPEIRKLELLSQKELAEISKIHKENIGKISVKTPRLIIGDLHPKNFFMKNGHFVSFIDLKAVMGGDPLWEYSLISYYLDKEIWPDYIKKTDSALRRYYFYLINIAINKLWFSYKIDRPLDKIKKQIRKYLNVFPKNIKN